MCDYLFVFAWYTKKKMKRFQVNAVDSNDLETPGTKNEVQLNAYNLYSQSSGNNVKLPITNNDVDNSRKFSFAQLTR